MLHHCTTGSRQVSAFAIREDHFIRKLDRILRSDPLECMLVSILFMVLTC